MRDLYLSASLSNLRLPFLCRAQLVVNFSIHCWFESNWGSYHTSCLVQPVKIPCLDAVLNHSLPVLQTHCKKLSHLLGPGTLKPVVISPSEHLPLNYQFLGDASGNRCKMFGILWQWSKNSGTINMQIFS